MLMDRHGTSRVLFRNTRNGVKGFPKRELHTIRCRCRHSIRRLLKSPALWARAKVRKTARAICSTRSVFIRNLKVITPPGGTSIRALSG